MKAEVQSLCGHPIACIRSTDEGTHHCGWCEELAKAEEEIAVANAKLAVMTELLLQVDVWLHDWAEKGGELYLPADDFRLVLRTKLKDALSAAPEVVWSGEATVKHEWKWEDGEHIVTAGLHFDELPPGWMLNVPDGQQVTILVLADDKPQEGE